jgi:hypothetical protein
MATWVAVGQIAPGHYHAEVRNVLSVRYTDQGNVVACLPLDVEGNGELSRHHAELPVGPLSSTDHPEVKRRASTVVGRGNDFGTMVDEAAMIEGCSDVPKDSDIFTIPNETYGSGSAHTPPNQPAFRAELYAGQYPWELFYIAQEPLRRVRLMKTEVRPEEWQDEHHIRFSFSHHRTSIRWGNVVLLPPAILVDAVTGPFGWIAVIKQHG